jgi:hypothetical protein
MNEMPRNWTRVFLGRLHRRRLAALLATAVLWMFSGMFPAQAEISGAQVWAFVEALRLAAPNTGIPNDGLYSPWKVKSANIARWSKRCLGRELTPEEFDSEPNTAREVVACAMGGVLREQYAAARDESVAVRRAASWWMTGQAEQYDSGSTAVYTEKVLRFYRQELH